MAHQSSWQTGTARKLRQKDNDAEAVLWQELRGRRLHGNKFVRELPIGKYFADFACREKKLIIEVDGSQHVESKTDTARDQLLNGEGWSVLRFSNLLVLRERQIVLSTIVEILEGRLVERIETNEWRYRPGCNSV